MSNSAVAVRELPLAKDPLACCVPLAREPISHEQAAGAVPMLQAMAALGSLFTTNLTHEEQG